MPQPFRLFCNRYYNKWVAFDAPEGFRVSEYGNSFYDGIRFFSNDLKAAIRVYGSYAFEANFLKKVSTLISREFTVKRGKREATAFYYNYNQEARFYHEYYLFENDILGNRLMNVVIWIIDKDDKYAAVKLLNQPQIKAFLDSIEYF